MTKHQTILEMLWIPALKPAVLLALLPVLLKVQKVMEEVF
jgi:hypothetical protein